MKFSHYLERMEDFSIFPLISLCIFFIIFCFVLIYVYSVDKKKLQNHAEMIMDSQKEEK